jgi:endonuclease/exonuclease/phosphatase family metal-dependent hydrolase
MTASLRLRCSAIAFALPLAAILLALVPAAADARRGDVTVMTRNLYVGVDLRRVVPPTTRDEFEQAAADTFQRAQASDFPARAKLIAQEIDRTGVDLIGMQEVLLLRRGPDGVKDGPATPATTVVQDFLAILQQELSARGLRYRVAVQNVTADVEVPTALGYDLRLTDRNVILAKVQKGLRLRNARQRNHTQALVIPSAVGPLRFTRGWASVDVTLNGASFRFVDAHPEAFSPGIRDAQIKQLLGRQGPMRTTKPIVLATDSNSDPKNPISSNTNATGYFTLTRAGFVDAWTRAHPRARGLTCCNQEDLLNPTSTFKERIDQVFTKPRVRVLDAELTGIQASGRTPAGQWPSDHAGVLAELRLPAR